MGVCDRSGGYSVRLLGSFRQAIGFDRLPAVARWADRYCRLIGIIHKGKLLELGTMAELRQRHEGHGKRLEEIFLEMVEEKEEETTARTN